MHRSTNRAPTLHQWDIADAASLPFPQNKRKLTDVICLILGVLFGLTLFIIAVATYNKGHLSKSQFPADSKGVVCMKAESNGTRFPFLYFNDLENPEIERYCVQDCPEQGLQTKCLGDCQLTYYPNYPSNSDLGALCLPNNQNLKATLIKNAGLGNTFNAIKAIDYLFVGFGISLGLAILWVIVVQLFPKLAVWATILAAGVLLAIASIIFFTASTTHLRDHPTLSIFLGIVSLGLMLLLVSYFCFHRKQLEISGCFLEVAGDCLLSNLSSLLYVLLFACLACLFIVLVVFQYLAFSSWSAPVLNGIYYENKANGLLVFLLGVQALWGLSFFRDAFNYTVSGIGSEWYFHKLGMCCYPLKRLFCKNLGSVAGGSFLTAFFYLPGLVVSFLAERVDSCVCNCLDLARSDAYTYIYLTGNSYCPSVRQVQYLCARSRICRENESALAIYAFCGRLGVALFSLLITYCIMKDNSVDQQVPFTLLAALFFLCLYLTSYLGDVHTLLAQALVVCFLSEQEMEEGWCYKQMRACPSKLAGLITDLEGGHH